MRPPRFDSRRFKNSKKNRSHLVAAQMSDFTSVQDAPVTQLSLSDALDADVLLATDVLNSDIIEI
jgi:hypothetical protein